MSGKRCPSEVSNKVFNKVSRQVFKKVSQRNPKGVQKGVQKRVQKRVQKGVQKGVQEVSPKLHSDFASKLPPKKLTPILQSLTGSLQGRISTQGDITGNGFAEYNFFLFWLHSFHVLLTFKVLL